MPRIKNSNKKMAGVLNAIRVRKEVHTNYHISVSIGKSAKRGHCTRAEQNAAS